MAGPQVKIERKYSNHLGKQFAEVRVNGRLITVVLRAQRPERPDPRAPLGQKVQQPVNDWGDVYPFHESRAAMIKAKAIEKASTGNPGRKHLPGATAKQQRQYEDILASAIASGRYKGREKEVAARTVRARQNPSSGFQWHGQSGHRVRFTKGEYKGMTGVVLSTVQKRYRKEPDMYRVQIDGFGKPGGWDGRPTVSGDVLESINPSSMKKKFSPAQIRAQKKFAAMSRARAKKARAGKRRNAHGDTFVEEYMGVKIYFAGSSYNAPRLKLFGYRTDTQLKTAIRKALSKQAGSKNPGKRALPDRWQVKMQSNGVVIWQSKHGNDDVYKRDFPGILDFENYLRDHYGQRFATRAVRTARASKGEFKGTAKNNPKSFWEMTSRDRDRLRKKQDRLIALAEKTGQDFNLRIVEHPGAPTLEQLRAYIHPEWEDAIDMAIKGLTRGGRKRNTTIIKARRVKIAMTNPRKKKTLMANRYAVFRFDTPLGYYDVAIDRLVEKTGDVSTFEQARTDAYEIIQKEFGKGGGGIARIKGKPRFTSQKPDDDWQVKGHPWAWLIRVKKNPAGRRPPSLSALQKASLHRKRMADPTSHERQAYDAGFNALLGHAARTGRTNVSPSQAEKEYWSYSPGIYEYFLQGFNDAKRGDEGIHRYKQNPDKRRRNSERKDSDHPIEVTKHWRAGPPGYLTPWQRAHALGQRQLFETGIKPAKRRNPLLKKIREEFSGQKARGSTAVNLSDGSPVNVAKLGRLVSISTQRGKIKMKRRRNPANTVWLTADTKGHLHLATTADRLIEGPARNFGEVREIEYETAKPHLGEHETKVFYHKFGEEGGERPILIADGNGGLCFKYGDYKIKREGIID